MSNHGANHGAPDATETTEPTDNSRSPQTSRSGNHAGNHGNHGAGNHVPPPLYKGGNVNCPAADDLEQAVDDRMAERLDAARRRQQDRREERALLAGRRTAGLAARHRSKTDREAGVGTSDDLRVALGRLGPRQRRALQETAARAGELRNGSAPEVAAVYTAFAAVVEEVDKLERARGAAMAEVIRTVRPAKRGKV